MTTRLRTIPGALCFLALVQAGLQAQTACDQLTGLQLDGASVAAASFVAAGDMLLDEKKPAAGRVHVPAHCEVKGLATPTSDSQIHFLLWLPAAASWNGKYLQKGSGGWGGVIDSRSLITPLARGYATAVTDDGHDGGPGARFVVGHPEKLIDFGYRAIHETSRQSRAIIRAYYTGKLRQAYFVGCSDGGREAMMQAERFPEDFSGIVAGAPANYWTHHFIGFIWNERALFQNGESVLPVSKLPLLQNAALKSCDALDGVRDGIIEDPRRCHFDPSTLLCGGSDNAACLTQAQVAAVQKIYAGPKDPVSGEQIYPGYEPGAEAEASTWAPWILGGVQAEFGNSNYADATYEDAKWDWRTSDLRRDMQLADAKVAPYVNSYNPDLRTFRDHGGKLIQYHGWADAAIAPRDSIRFYELVGQFMTRYPDPRAPKSGESIGSFYRLFMAPGMGHCSGGTGPDSFGNDDLESGIPQDPEHDIVLALDRWVTEGVAPEQIIASRIPRAGSPEKLMTRPLCAYPKVAHYRGSGSTDDARNFACVETDASR